MSDKIKLLDTGGKNEMIAAFESLKRELPSILQQVAVIAEIRKASFDAHVKHGFTEEQALELCKSIAL